MPDSGVSLPPPRGASGLAVLVRGKPIHSFSKAPQPFAMSDLLSFSNPPRRLRATAFLEGVSYVLLLGVAMPLKYYAGYPLAVTLVGGLHGFLFVALAMLVFDAVQERRKSWKWAGKMALAALLPFAVFFLDRELRDDCRAWAATRGA